MPIPKQMLQPSAHQLQIRQGGGCLSIFGLPFFAAGLYVLALGLGFLSMKGGQLIEVEGRVIMGLMGALFTAIGGALVFGRQWLMIDMFKRRIVTQWGLLIPMKTRDEALADYALLSLRLDRGDSDSPDRYALVLSTKDGQRRRNLVSYTVYKQAREAGLFVAGFLHLPLHDQSTTSEEVIRPGAEKGDVAPATVDVPQDESITQIASSAPPVGMVATISEVGGVTTIVIPSEKLSFFHVLVAIVPAIVIMNFLYAAFRKVIWDFTKPDSQFNIFVFGIVFLFILLPIYQVGRRLVTAHRGVWRIVIDRGQITVEGSGEKYQFAAESVVSIEDAEEMVEDRRYPLPSNPRLRGNRFWLLMSRSCLIVKTTSDRMKFVLGVAPEEAAYLRAFIESKINRK